MLAESILQTPLLFFGGTPRLAQAPVTARGNFPSSVHVPLISLSALVTKLLTPVVSFLGLFPSMTSCRNLQNSDI